MKKPEIIGKKLHYNLKIYARDEIKTVYRPLLSLTEPTFDNVEKLQEIKNDVSIRGRSGVVFREGLVLNIETGVSLLTDGNNLCKTIEKISVYDNGEIAVRQSLHFCVQLNVQKDFLEMRILYYKTA